MNVLLCFKFKRVRLKLLDFTKRAFKSCANVKCLISTHKSKCMILTADGTYTWLLLEVVSEVWPIGSATTACGSLAQQQFKQYTRLKFDFLNGRAQKHFKRSRFLTLRTFVALKGTVPLNWLQSLSSADGGCTGCIRTDSQPAVGEAGRVPGLEGAPPCSAHPKQPVHEPEPSAVHFTYILT